MRKFLCCLLALLTLGVGTVTAVSCGGSSGGSGSSVETSIDESKVTLRLTKKVYNIENGQTAALELDFKVDGEAEDVSLLSFTSSDPAIAAVSADGVVTGVSGGRAYITVACGTKTVKATINVTMRENRLTLSDESVSLLVGDTKQVSATVYFGLSEVTDAAVLWQSSDPAVATVENGVITGVGNGKTTVTATYEDVSAAVEVTVFAETAAENVNSFGEEYINIYGRSYVTADGLNLDHAANGVEVGIVGGSLKVTICSSGKSKMRVFVDGDASGEKMDVDVGTKEYTVASGLTEGCHVVRIVKATEEQTAQWDVLSFAADKFFVAPEKSDLKIEFIGDSITAGYGLYGSSGDGYTVENSDCSKTYAYLAARELNADYSIVAWSGICAKAYYWCSNLNMTTLYNQISNTNKTAYAFDFDADVVVVNLGTNEASYITDAGGNSSYEFLFPIDYMDFLSDIREKHPEAYIICLYGMMGKNVVVNNGIQSAVDALDDEKIVYNPFAFEANQYGANGHPNNLAQKTWGEALAAYIQTLDI
ncbi:MAG: Ig-like domain-containing protein [Clostridia bacterium]|nr:Ig-like domain-containing protein [Clostridia bacterium]